VCLPLGASSYALACDLLGHPPDEAEGRPTVAEAMRDCRPGQVMAACEGGRDIVVCTLEDGRTFAVPDWCPHDGGRLSDGFVEAGRLVCARHGWELDPATGQRVRPSPRNGEAARCAGAARAAARAPINDRVPPGSKS
jgi:nitrite reductase/ring-hydroxylating ferredoxin subunit